MLWAYLTIAVFLFSGARAQEDEVAEIDEKRLKQYVQDRCEKYDSAAAFEKIGESIDGFQNCLNSKPHTLEDEPSNDEKIFKTLCEEYHPAAYSCVEDVLEVLESCMDPKEKFLSSFILATFNSSFEGFCEGGVSGLKDRRKTHEEAKCITLPFTLQGLVSLCLPKMSLWKERSNPDYILTESDFCSDIDKGKECVITNLQKVCEEDVITEIVRPRLEPFVNWCNERELENLLD